MTEARWPLHTNRLTLRPHRPEDLDWLVTVYSQPEVARYLLEDPWTRAVAHERLEDRLKKTDLEGPSHALALVVEADSTPVGDIALWMTDTERRCAEIGWVLDPRRSGHGYAQEAAAAVLNLAFDAHRLHRIVAQMDARNAASARLATKLHMRQEAHHLQDYWSKGEWTDSLIFALLSTDPR